VCISSNLEVGDGFRCYISEPSGNLQQGSK
jgi:hypothetical protein